MALDRGDLVALFQRLAETLVRLGSERMDLARLELRDEAERLLGLAARILFGATAAAVGLVMMALAATELLGPLVASPAARLLLVGAPLCAAGTAHVAMIARALGRPRALDPSERSDEEQT